MADDGRQREHELAARAERARERAAEEVDRSVMLHSIVHALRAPAAQITSCAWCGRYHVGEKWYPESSSRLLHALDRTHALTHGICPSCFAELAPADLSYPPPELSA